jgi:hypothetical protein
MQNSLEILRSLVRRRGHTNDPTQEIAVATRQLETDGEELKAIVQQILASRCTSSQHKKHLEYLAQWLQNVASQQTAKLKEVLKIRGTVLASQAQRRKLWNPQQSLQQAPAKQAAVLKSSPLFSEMVTPTKPAANGSGLKNPPSAAGAAGNGYAGAYGGGSYGGAVSGYNNNNNSGGYAGYGGYGGYYNNPTSTTGIRHRRPATATSYDTNESVEEVQQQVQMRQEIRQTASRLESAKQAEQSLAHLSTLFGKMSNLIVQQGETLTKVEDDVEAALGDVTAGQQEIQTLYALKKGNRMLILKTFAVLIFVIIFMRLY